MARYLTPALICTLVLIKTYQSDDFWTFQSSTSAAILQLIAEQCLQRSEPSTLDLEKSTALPRNVLEYGRSLAALEAELPGRSWLSVLVRELWKLHTIDEFHDLFNDCMQLLVLASGEAAIDGIRPPAITRASPIGQFIRKCNVEFTRLQFAESLASWQNFVAYREPSRGLWTQHYPDAARSAFSEYISAATPRIEPLADIALVGPDTINTILTASVSQLQKLGQRVPTEVKIKLKEWLSTQPASQTQSLHHFMSFFDTWRAGQYSLALENLHRYFDYSVAKGAGDDMKAYYQYALLHLSVLHADFEHWDESVSAMKECIVTARENQDTACLNFALSWLLYLRQSRHTRDSVGLHSLASIAGEGGSEYDEITFLKAKAREGKHWTLMSSTVLEEAKFELRHHGISTKAIELVLQSSYLNIQHALQSVMPATSIFQAAIFDRLGQAHLAKQIHASAFSTFAQHCSLADSTRFVCRLAYDAAQRGHYAKSMSMLQDFRPRITGTLKLEQRIIAFADALALMRAIRRSDMQAAEYHIINLRPIRDNADPDIVALADQLEIALLTKQHRLDVALVKINASIERTKGLDKNDMAEALSLLIQKANLFAAAGRPTKGFSIALRAVSSAQRCHLVGLFTEALNALAHIFNELGKFEAARELSEAALPHALEGSNMLVVAQLFVTLGESYVGLITSTQDASESKQSQMAHVASSYIERGREVYEEIEEYEGQLDCLLMQARLARWSDDEPSADRADAKYYQLVIDHESNIVGSV